MSKTTKEEINFMLESLNDKSKKVYSVEKNISGYKLLSGGTELHFKRVNADHIWLILEALNKYVNLEGEKL